VNKLYHEELYRSDVGMRRLRDRLVTVCGAGALGANLCESLARSGVDTLRVIDFDRIEEHNLSTQPYQTDDIGARKAETLGLHIYRSVGTEVDARLKRLDSRTVGKLLKGSELVLDCFDNSRSRKLVKEHCETSGIACLHAGLADGFGEVIWNECYRVPSPSQDDICDYPLARNLVTLVMGVAAEAVIRYLLEGEKTNWSITLRDLSIRRLEM